MKPKSNIDQDQIIRWKTPTFFGETRESLSKKLSDHLRGRVLESWIFGSVARNEIDSAHDIDLMIVMETEKSFLERVPEFFDLYDIMHPIDILVYTPDEFKRLTTNPSPGFWRSVSREMVRIL